MFDVSDESEVDMHSNGISSFPPSIHYVVLWSVNHRKGRIVQPLCSNNHASNLYFVLDSRLSHFFQHWHILAISRLKMNASVWFHLQGDMGEDGLKGEMGEKVCRFNPTFHTSWNTPTQKQQGTTESK